MTKVQSKSRKVAKVTIATAVAASSIPLVAAPGVMANKFSDVSPTNSHADNIAQLAARGVIDGYKDGTFKPNQYITRAQAAKIIANTLNLDTTNVTNPNFKDIPTSHPYYGYIAALAAADVIQGYEGNFNPNNHVTRGQMAKFIALGFKLKEGNGKSFKDVPTNHQYARYISSLATFNISTGKANGKFEMHDLVTRGQLASFVVRAEKAVSEAAPSNKDTIEGTIEKIEKDAITINGQQITVSEQFKFLTAAENKTSLQNADISLVIKDKSIEAVKQLTIDNGETFHGYGTSIEELVVKSNVKQLDNITATSITYEVSNEPVTLKKVKAKKLVVSPKSNSIASTNNKFVIQAVPTINLDQATIEEVDLQVKAASLSESNSSINVVNASNTSALTLNGLFNEVVLANNASVTGQAQVKTFTANADDVKNISFAQTISAQQFNVADKAYSWSEAVKQFDIIQNSPSENIIDGSNNEGSNDNGGGSSFGGSFNSGGGSSSGGNTSTDGGSNTGGNTNGSSNSGENKDNKTPSQTITIDTEKLSVTEDGKLTIGDQAYILTEQQQQLFLNEEITIEYLTVAVDKDNKVSSFEELTATISSSKFDGQAIPATESLTLKGNVEMIENVNANALVIDSSAQNVTIKGNKVSQNITSNVAVTLYDVETINNVDAPAITISSSAKQVTVDNGTQAENITSNVPVLLKNVQTVSQVDAPSINIDTEIEQVVVIGNKTVQNITSNANLAVTGAVQEISNIDAENVIIQTSGESLQVKNISGDITIEEPPVTKVAKLRNVFASLKTIANIQTTSTFNVTFADGDYSGKTLSVKRTDTKVDVQSDKPFTQYEVLANNFALTSNAKVARIAAYGKVSSLNLEANVTELDTTLNGQSLVLTSAKGITIEKFKLNSPLNESELKNTVDAINVTLPTKVNLATKDVTKEIDLSHNIFMKNNVVVGDLSATLTFARFGQYKITSDNSGLRYAQLKANEDPANFKATLHPSTVDYTANSNIIIYHDTTNIVVYEVDGSNVVKASKVITAPNINNVYSSDINSETGARTFIARARDTETVKDVLNYFILFDEGELKYQDLNLTNVDWEASKTINLPTVNIETGYKPNTVANEMYITADSLIKSDNFPDTSPYFVTAMNNLATFIKDKKPAQGNLLMRPFLKHISGTTGTQFDSLFLDKYVAALNDPTADFKTVADLKALIEKIAKENEYAKETVLINTDALLTGAFTNDIAIRDESVLSAQISGGKLLFSPKKAGNTTVRVTDGTDATLLNVKVTGTAGAYTVTATVVKQAATAGTLLEGADSFRFVNGDILPTEFGNNIAIIQGTDLKKVTVTENATTKLHDITAPETLTVTELNFADFGFDNTIQAPVKNDFFGAIINNTTKKITLYSKNAGSIQTTLTDGVNRTAIHINSTGTGVTETIAASVLIKLSDLGLTNIDNISFSTDLKNVHVVKTATNVQLFSSLSEGGNESGYVTFEDLVTGHKTLLNMLAGGNPITIEEPTVVQTNITGIDASITSISPSDNPNIRYDGLKIYALKAGTSLVKLTNGQQYTVVTGPAQTDAKHLTMEATEVKTAHITSTELNMTNIANATFTTGTGSIDKVNGDLYVTLNSDGIAELKVFSNTDPVEYTTVYVTRAANGDYSTDVDSSTLPLTDFNLNATSTNLKVLTDASTSSRAVIDGENVRAYSATEGVRILQITDGTNVSAMNTTITRKDNRYKATLSAVLHTLPAGLEADATFKATQLHVSADGKKLYATGNGLLDGATQVRVPLKDGSIYVIDLAVDTVTKQLQFEAKGDVIFNKTFTAAQLGLDTITDASVTNLTNGTIAATKVENNAVIVSTLATGNARVQVTGSKGSSSTAITNIFVTKADGTAPVLTVEKLADANHIKFSNYGIGTVSAANLLPTDIVREVRTATEATFYALAEGKTAYTVEDSSNKAIFNVEVSKDATTEQFTVTQSIAQYVFGTGVTGEIISGNSVRLSKEKDAAYIVAKNGTTRILLSTGAVIDLTVKEAGGHYSAEKTDVANTTTVKPQDLDSTLADTVVFTNATGSNPNIFTTDLLNGQVVIYGKAAGTTSLTLTTNEGKTFVANVAVDAVGKIVTADTKIVKATHPTASKIEFLHDEDKALAKIDTNQKTLYALDAGVVELVVTDENNIRTIERVNITKDQNGKFTMSNFTKISSTILSTNELGLGSNVANTFTIETSSMVKSGTLGNDIYVYSNLSNGVTGATDLIVTANASGLKTAVRLVANGETLDHTIMAQNDVFTTAPTTIEFDSANNLVRYEKTNNLMYAYKEGHTHAFVNSDLYAIQVQRDAEQIFKTTATALSLSAPNKADNSGKEEVAAMTGSSKTDETIVRLDTENDVIYAVGLGSTQVKVGNAVWTVYVEKAANGQVTIRKEIATSATVTKEELGLDSIVSYNVLTGADAIRITQSGDSLIIYSNGVQTAQTARITVADDHNSSIINVSLDAAGHVTSAKPAIAEAITAKIAETTAAKNTIARVAWKDNIIQVYALEKGLTALQTNKGIINVNVTENASKVLSATASLVQDSIEDTVTQVVNDGIVEVIAPTGSETKTTLYAKKEGTAFLIANNQLYIVNVTKQGEHFAMTVSDPMAYTEFAIGTGTVAAESILNGVDIVVDFKGTLDNKSDDTLLIYSTGNASDKGISDIVISSGGEKTLYHTKAEISNTTAPTGLDPAFQSLAALGFTNTVVDALTNSPVRQNSDELYALKEGSFTATGTHLVNGNVTRNAEGKLTASLENASTTLKEALPTGTTLTKFSATGTTLAATENNASEVFLTDNYRVTATSKLENGQYKVAVDERHMVAINLTKYDFTNNVTFSNPEPSKSLVEKRDGKMVFYAGTAAGTTTIVATEKDTNGAIIKEVTFTVTQNDDKTITVTPAVSEEAIKFTNLGLTVANKDEIEITNNNVDIATTLHSATGISFVAKAEGTTSIIIKQGTTAKALVNIKVEKDTQGKLIVKTPEIIKLTGTYTNELYKTEGFSSNANTTGYYPTSVGTIIYKNADDKAIAITVTKGENHQYTVTEKTANYKAFTSDELGLDDIGSVTATSAVATHYTDGSKLYLLAANAGSTDITVNNKIGSKKTVIVANNGSTFTAVAGIEALKAEDTNIADWPSNEYVQIRNNTLYPLTTGTALVTGTKKLSDTKTINVFMNVQVTRNDKREFVTKYSVVKDASYTTASLLSGDSVFIHENVLYAQKPGTSTVVLNNAVREVTVTLLANGTYDMKVADAAIQKVFAAGDFGLDSITARKLNALTGSNVIELKTVGEKLAVVAKNEGQAEVSLNEGQAWMHVLVTSEDGVLKIQESIAKELPLGTAFTADTSTNTSVVRIKEGILYGITEGETIVNAGTALYKVVVKKQNNILSVKASPIEANLGFTPADASTFTNDYVDLVGSKLVAKKVTTTVQEITIENRLFRFEITANGSMSLTEVFGDSVDLSKHLSKITVDPTHDKLNITVEADKTSLKVTPKDQVDSGTYTFAVTDENGKALQVQASVTGTKVKLSLVEVAVSTLPLGFYPTSVKTPDGTQTLLGTEAIADQQVSADNGVVKIVNDKVVFYPGKPGKAHFLIEGGGNTSAIYEINVKDDLTYTVQPFTTAVGFSALASSPTVLTNHGNATAKLTEDGFTVTINDTNPSTFVIHGNDNSYKTILVEAVLDATDPDTYKANAPVIHDNTEDNGTLLTGEISDAAGAIKSIYDSVNNKTVFYGLEAGNGSFKWKDKLYNVTVGEKPFAISIPTLVTSAPNTPTSTAIHFAKDNVIVLDGGNYTAIATGTGIYKVNNSDYVEITVDKVNDHYAITSQTAIVKDETFKTATKVELLKGENVYVDGTTLLGDITSNIVVRVTTNNKTTLYKGTLNNLVAAELNINELLGWTIAPKSSDLDPNNKLVRIEEGKIVATGLATGDHVITFTSINGLTQAVTVNVSSEDYSFTKEGNNPNIITFTERKGSSTGSTYTLTFDVNVNATVIDTTTVAGVTLAEIPSDDSNIGISSNRLNIYYTPDFLTGYSEAFKITIPELNNTEFSPTVTVEYVGNGIWKPGKVQLNEEQSKILQFHNKTE